MPINGSSSFDFSIQEMLRGSKTSSPPLAQSVIVILEFICVMEKLMLRSWAAIVITPTPLAVRSQVCPIAIWHAVATQPSTVVAQAH